MTSGYTYVNLGNYTTGNNITLTNDIARTYVTGQKATLDPEEYRELLDDQRMLYALIDAGVEDWEGYNEALANYREAENAEE